MITIHRASPAEMREAHRTTEKAFGRSVPVLNLGNAVELGRHTPLFWGGEEFTVKVISYREGLELQRAQLQLERWASSPAKTEEDVEDCEADLIQTLALFHSLLQPKPERNPFADAAPQEVGALLGFFSVCLTMQGGSSRLTRPAPVSSTR